MKKAVGARVSPSTAFLMGESLADRSRHFFASSSTASVMTCTSSAIAGLLPCSAEHRQRLDFQLRGARRLDQVGVAGNLGDADTFKVRGEVAVRPRDRAARRGEQPLTALDAVQLIVVVGQDAPDLTQPHA